MEQTGVKKASHGSNKPATQTTKEGATMTENKPVAASDNVLLRARCVKHGIAYRTEYRLAEAQVLLETSPVWTRRMCLQKKMVASHKMVTITSETGESQTTEMWIIPAESLEKYLVAQRKEEELEALRKEDPRGYYKSRRGMRRLSAEEFIASMSTEEKASLLVDLLSAEKKLK